MMLFFIGTNKLLILGSVDSLNIYCSFGHFNPKMNLFGILSNKILDSVHINFEVQLASNALICIVYLISMILFFVKQINYGFWVQLILT